MEYLSDGGSLLDRDDVPESVKNLFHTAADISPTSHVLMQSAFQESTDAGISKTINFPNEATIEDVENAYMLAWETKCKGITVYRSGSRQVEVLTSGHDTSNDKTRDDLNGESSNSVSSFESICISLVNLTPTSVPKSIKPSEVRLNSMSLSGSQSASEESGSRHCRITFGSSVLPIISPINRTRSLGITSILMVVSSLTS